MNYNLPEEMKLLQDMTYKFAKVEISPFSEECDEEEKYTPEIHKKAAELGLVGSWIPEEYGGAGFGVLSVTVDDVTTEITLGDRF